MAQFYERRGREGGKGREEGLISTNPPYGDGRGRLKRESVIAVVIVIIARLRSHRRARRYLTFESFTTYNKCFFTKCIHGRFSHHFPFLYPRIPSSTSVQSDCVYLFALCLSVCTFIDNTCCNIHRKICL